MRCMGIRAAATRGVLTLGSSSQHCGSSTDGSSSTFKLAVPVTHVYVGLVCLVCITYSVFVVLTKLSSILTFLKKHMRPNHALPRASSCNVVT